jgi:magnesium chelatase family protein
VQRYRHRISGPLLDRLDLVVEVPAPSVEELATASAHGAESSEAALRSRVDRAIAARRARQGERRNGELSADEIDRFAPLAPDGRSLVGAAARRRGLSARAIQSLRRVARTVADLDGDAEVGTAHLAQALALRAEIG